MTPATVRRWDATDLEAITTLHEACWREAYADLMPPGFVDEVFADRAAHVVRRREQLAAGRDTWVAEVAGVLVGFASSGPARLVDAPTAHELYALYARASVWGTGVGHALHEVAVGDRAAYLWTLAGNERSRAFYERQGYRADGVVDDQPAGRHVRMVRTGRHHDREGATIEVMIALTGCTGALGGLVAAALADLGPRLIVRDPSRAPDLGLPVHQASYADGGAAQAALTGVDVLLMVSAAESGDRRAEHRSFITAATRAGVRHVVYTSFCGADPAATFTLGRDHADAEAAIIESGMAYTFLRDNFYLDVLPLFADESGVIRGPAGAGRVSAVARADVADVATAVLRDPGAHADAAYVLTGPEALTLADVAERAGVATGRRLSFVDETLPEAYASRRAAYPDAADWQLDAWVSTYTAIADGSCAEVTDHVERLTGHRARTLEEALAG